MTWSDQFGDMSQPGDDNTAKQARTPLATSQEAMREAFEAYIRANHPTARLHRNRFDNNEYAYPELVGMWGCWKTAAGIVWGSDGGFEVKYKCTTCWDTGKIKWRDYSNGQGLDIDHEDDCACRLPPMDEVRDEVRDE